MLLKVYPVSNLDFRFSPDEEVWAAWVFALSVTYEEVDAWCEETFGQQFDGQDDGLWHRGPNRSIYIFKNKHDAMIFKLHWG